jgi:hypothetical protein
MACNDFRVDVTASSFGMCKCGYKKADHGAAQAAVASDLEGEDRELHFKPARFVKYYLCDLLAVLGPLHGHLIAPLVWGRRGATSMGYLPGSARAALAKWLVQWPIFSLAFVVVPLLEAVLVLWGARDPGGFDPLAQGTPVLLFWLVPPLASACKYSLMNTARFERAVLKQQQQQQQQRAEAPHPGSGGGKRRVFVERGDHLDQTVDRIKEWTRCIENELIARQFKLALWRTGGVSDGAAMALTLRDGTRVPLGELLECVARRHRDAPEFRAVRLRLWLSLLLLLPLSCIPNAYRAVRGTGPFWGADDWSVAANVCAVLSSVTCLDYILFWGVNKTAGHLRRAGELEAEWARLALHQLFEHTPPPPPPQLPPPQQLPPQPQQWRQQWPPKLAATGPNVRAWARGRDALVKFGYGYWLRLSLSTAVLMASVAVLVAVLLVELAVRMVGGAGGVTISAFHLVVAAICTLFWALFAKLVLVAMSITSARADLRTSLLRLAAWRNGDADVGAALRDAAAVILSEETCSGQLCLLGVPLDAVVLKTMFSSLVFIAIGFYQEAAKVRR